MRHTTILHLCYDSHQLLKTLFSLANKKDYCFVNTQKVNSVNALLWHQSVLFHPSFKHTPICQSLIEFMNFVKLLSRARQFCAEQVWKLFACVMQTYITHVAVHKKNVISAFWPSWRSHHICISENRTNMRAWAPVLVLDSQRNLRLG